MSNSPIVYLEIPATNFESTKAFYSEVFNWKVEDSYLDDKPYAMFETGDAEFGLTGGGFNPDLKPLAENTLSLFISVEDINQTLAKMNELGGKTLREKTEIGGDHGFFGQFIDPNGNHLGLWSKS